MVTLAAGVEEILDKVGEELTKQVKENIDLYAPQISGSMAHSVTVVRVAEGRWEASTHAYGENGFEYPAHIEKGQPVRATQAKALHFKIHGRDIYTKSVRGSKKPNFMKNTKNNLHI